MMSGIITYCFCGIVGFSATDSDNNVAAFCFKFFDYTVDFGHEAFAAEFDNFEFSVAHACFDGRHYERFNEFVNKDEHGIADCACVFCKICKFAPSLNISGGASDNFCHKTISF